MIERIGTRPTLCLSRRDLVGGAASAMFAAHAFAATHAEAPVVTPKTALKRLEAGNARYVAGRSLHPDLGAARRAKLANGQHPFATILACADSRVGPELIFDQGLGDLFVIRVAGNVVDDSVLASIEYSVIHLGAPLVMALGHERCGAVSAAVDAAAGKTNPEDKDTKIGALAGLILPAVKAAPADAPDKVEAAVELNAQRSAHLIAATSPAVARLMKTGRLQVVSALYGLKSGKVFEIRAAEL
jgi:carbonic anhydrase